MQRLYMYDAAEASKQAEQVWFQARPKLVTATALGARQQYIKICTVYVTENTLPWLLAATFISLLGWSLRQSHNYFIALVLATETRSL